MNLITTSVKTFNFCIYGMPWRALTAALLSLACIMPMNSLLAQGRQGQPNEILLKGGHVIDPKNG